MDISSLAWGVTAVMAHVLYGLPRAGTGGARRIHLHNGDDFAPSDLSPRPDRLAGVRMVTAAGVVPLLAEGDPATRVFVDIPEHVEAPGWLVVESPPTSIELAGARFTSYLAHEGLTAVLAARAAATSSDAPGREIYSKHTKTALRSGDDRLALLTTPIGLAVEFVPAAATLRRGDTLEVTLLADGRPAPDRQVRIHHRGDGTAAAREVACLRADAFGRVRVIVDAPGDWRCHAVEMAAHDDLTKADWRSRWACLTFGL